MNCYQIFILACTIMLASSSYVNTTDFWQKTLNVNSTHYECYSGYQEIDWFYNKGQSGMYYSLFSAAGQSVIVPDQRVPLIIWLQGGPGSSSQFGAFTELGPIRFTKEKVQEFGQSWNLMGHTLFIDQPIGVGFSYTKDTSKPLVSSARQAANHLVNFLSNFYKQWPALKKSPLYITGESFAGHYIPAFAAKILNNDTFLKETGIVLEGIAIGDGWTDPYNQINYYDSYLYSVGIVSTKFRETATWFQTQAIERMMRNNFKNATPFFDFLTNNDDTRRQYWGGMSTYNFRKYSDPDVTFAGFLDAHRSYLGVPTDVRFASSNEKIYEAFQEDISLPYVFEVAFALRRIRVLIYNGQDDFVVNTPGVLAYINGINWEGIPQWKRTTKQIWTIHGQIKGWAKVSGNLWFVLVNHAGHMVPTDQPEAAANMIGHFIFNNRDWKE